MVPQEGWKFVNAKISINLFYNIAYESVFFSFNLQLQPSEVIRKYVQGIWKGFNLPQGRGRGDWKGFGRTLNVTKKSVFSFAGLKNDSFVMMSAGYNKKMNDLFKKNLPCFKRPFLTIRLKITIFHNFQQRGALSHHSSFIKRRSNFFSWNRTTFTGLRRRNITTLKKFSP